MIGYTHRVLAFGKENSGKIGSSFPQKSWEEVRDDFTRVLTLAVLSLGDISGGSSKWSENFQLWGGQFVDQTVGKFA